MYKRLVSVCYPTEASNSGIITENITLLKKMLAPAATDPSHVMSYFVVIAVFVKC